MQRASRCSSSARSGARACRGERATRRAARSSASRARARAWWCCRRAPRRSRCGAVALQLGARAPRRHARSRRRRRASACARSKLLDEPLLAACVAGQVVGLRALDRGASRSRGPPPARSAGANSSRSSVAVGDRVEAVALAAAAERAVAPLARDPVAGEHEGLLERQALGDVAGDRVAVLERGAVTRLAVEVVRRRAGRAGRRARRRRRAAPARPPVTMPRSPLATPSAGRCGAARRDRRRRSAPPAERRARRRRARRRRASARGRGR